MAMHTYTSNKLILMVFIGRVRKGFHAKKKQNSYFSPLKIAVYF